MADMSYQDQLADLSQLDTKGLSALEKSIIAAFNDAESADDLDAMSSAAEALDQVREAKATASGNESNVESVGAPEATTTDGGTEAAPAAAVAASAEGGDGGDGEADAEAEAESDGDDADAGGDGDESDEDEDDAEKPGEVVTAAGKMPDALKNHQFKKKGAPAEGSDAEEADESDEEESKEDKIKRLKDAVTASSQEETEVAVEQDDIPEDRQPIVASSTTTIVAGADIPQRAAGSEFGSYMEVSDSFVARLQTLRNSRGGDGDQVIIASVQNTIDPDRELIPGDDAQNYGKIESVVSRMKNVDREALVASGGYCAPLETRYDIFGFGVTDRPVRDSLAGFQASRGGIRYVAPPILSSFSGAVGLWTAANDASPSAPATKPLMTVACQNEITVTTDAVTLQLQFGNLMTRAYPELVARNNELGLIYHARFAEQTLLNKISALSTAVSSAYALGTARDFVYAIGRAASAYRTRHRLSGFTPLRVMAPAWVLDAMREDLTRGYPGDHVDWADAEITAMLTERNVNVTWHIDDPSFTGVQNAGNINEFPATIKWWIFAEGTFLFLDGGTLDLGIVRDSTLVGTNDYRMFVETFEGVAKVGVESIQVTTTTHVTGAIVGTVTPS